MATVKKKGNPPDEWSHERTTGELPDWTDDYINVWTTDSSKGRISEAPVNLNAINHTPGKRGPTRG